jgi:hypothetical protein
VVVVDFMIVEVIVELITVVGNAAAVPVVPIKISFVWNISILYIFSFEVLWRAL